MLQCEDHSRECLIVKWLFKKYETLTKFYCLQCCWSCTDNTCCKQRVMHTGHKKSQHCCGLSSCSVVHSAFTVCMCTSLTWAFASTSHCKCSTACQCQFLCLVISIESSGYAQIPWYHYLQTLNMTNLFCIILQSRAIASIRCALKISDKCP